VRNPVITQQRRIYYYSQLHPQKENKENTTCHSVIYHSLNKTEEENKVNIKVGRGKAAAEVSTTSLKGRTGKTIKVIRTKNL